MEKADALENQTHDFMNVESFSQLPFIRPAPIVKEKPIKLFGIEFGGGAASMDTEESDQAPTTTEEAPKERVDNGESSNRRFECHYCCRNFPTSQALGGHQNAHKRERQHAKRAHLQSAMVHGSLSDYGFMNYHQRAAPTWNVNGSGNTRSFYGSSSSFSQQTINGSPLAMWRIQNNPSSSSSSSFYYTNNNRETLSSSSVQPLPLFAGDNPMMRPSPNGSSHGRYVSSYEAKPKSMQDQVSLDLHL